MIESPIKRALISVSDKTGIVEFALNLQDLQIEILSTGGTAKLLREHNIPVIDVSEHTQFPEIMNGRVKTLHPKILGGILARREIDATVMKELGIQPIDLVVVNLYPFSQIIAQQNSSLEEAIENIDIGGPTMLRAAAKNFQAVTVIVEENDYQHVLNEIKKNHGNTTLDTRFKLAQKVFIHTAEYDKTIANYLTQTKDENILPEFYSLNLKKKQNLRYGENPHQRAAFYRTSHVIEPSITVAEQLQGKELSFNNITDADAALEVVKSFDDPACVIVKHANPCGVAVNKNIMDAYDKAFAADPQSAFGGVIAFNKTLDANTAQKILDSQFVEVIVATAFDPVALKILSNKSSIRLLSCGNVNSHIKELDYKKVTGGFLIQERDEYQIQKSDLRVVTQRKPTEKELDDLLFAWKVVKHVKSNAIVIARDHATIGIGAGQMSRVDSVFIALTKAKMNNFSLAKSVMASDAFFPFRDSIDHAGREGITAIIQPGGSIRDEEVIAAADEFGIAMVFTGVRHFKH